MTTSEHEQNRSDPGFGPNTEPKLPTKPVVTTNAPLAQDANNADATRKRNSQIAKTDRKRAKAENDGDDSDKIRDVFG